MTRRKPWFSHLSRTEAAALGAIEGELKWLNQELDLALGPENKDKRTSLRRDIDAARMRRLKLVNRGSARARLSEKTGRQVTPMLIRFLPKTTRGGRVLPIA